MRYLITLFLLTVSQAYGVIIETAHFSEIVPQLKKDTLVILDIDDTLLIPVQMMGCDVWFESRLKAHSAEGMSSQQALEKSLHEWEAVRHITKMEVVEPGTEAIVADLQKQGYTVMGLTTQGLALATCTCQQLLANQMNLKATAPYKEDICFPIHGNTVIFRNGILFTAGTSKGESLFTLCEKIGYTPTRIVFINDKATHLRDIEAVAEKRGVEFIGLRYAYSDSRKKAFSPEIAAYQFDHSTFQHIVSDEEARAGMK